MRDAGFIVLFIYLLLMSVYDIKTRKIHLGISGIAAAVLTALYVCLCIWERGSWLSGLLGTAVGVAILFISWVTKGEIGMGDGLVFVISGLLLNVFENGLLLFISLALAAAAGVLLVLFRRVGRTYRLPFIPFVFVGYGVICLWHILS